MLNNIVRNTLLNTTAAAALCGIAAVGANAQSQFNDLHILNGNVTVCVNSMMGENVNIMGYGSTDGVIVAGIGEDALGLGNPVVDSWNTSLTNVVGLSSFGSVGSPIVLAQYMVPAGTAAGTYSDNLFFTSHDVIGMGAAITPFSIIVTNGPCSTPEPGNVAMLAGMGLTGAGFLARRRRK